jgi:hypothetical protein
MERERWHDEGGKKQVSDQPSDGAPIKALSGIAAKMAGATGRRRIDRLVNLAGEMR